jgi:undecaprenyl-diphosphatase
VKFLLFGTIQGLTEFLPISSSGHLYILKRLTGTSENLLPFFVFLHLATFLAIVLYFRTQIIRALLKRNFIINIFLITAISGGVALAIKYILSTFFGNKYLLSFCFLINGIILLSINKINPRKDIYNINLKESLILGLVQGIAVFPGISRSGITIATLLKRGYKEKEAFKLSFFMALPIILLAFLAEFKELTPLTIGYRNMAVGFIFAFLSGILALIIVKKTLINTKFKNFGYYCLLIFIIAIFL